MDRIAYENVKDQLGRCGIWCGCCIVGNGVEAELARRHIELIGGYGIDHWGPAGADYEGLKRTMAALGALDRCPGCRKAGGRDCCPIRACAEERGHDDCTCCAEAGSCSHTEDIEHMRAGAAKARMFVKAERCETGALLASWEARQRSRWPDALLFLE